MNKINLASFDTFALPVRRSLGEDGSVWSFDSPSTLLRTGLRINSGLIIMLYSPPVRPECSPKSYVGECIEGLVKKFINLFGTLSSILRYIRLRQGFAGHSGRTGGRINIKIKQNIRLITTSRLTPKDSHE